MSWSAHAKLNLRLAVLAREGSGFHQIETLFCALDLADEIDIDVGHDGIALTVTAADGDPDLGAAADNLAVRAARAFFAAAGLPERAGIRLHKRIPAGAGLGGGSSDAATVLRALNELHGLPLDREALLRAGATLGSDVPFFLLDAPLVLAWGRGGRMLPLPPLPPRPVLLAVPPEGVATARAYADLAAARAEGWAAAPAALPPRIDWDAIADLAVNDFEATVFPRMPLLGELRAALAAAGAHITRMTGSGSVVYGVFGNGDAAEAARQALLARFGSVRWIVTRTRG